MSGRQKAYKPGSPVDDVGKRIFEFTACISDGRDLLIYTDEGDENPIRVERYRLKALITAAIAALTGEKGTW